MCVYVCMHTFLCVCMSILLELRGFRLAWGTAGVTHGAVWLHADVWLRTLWDSELQLLVAAR